LQGEEEKELGKRVLSLWTSRVEGKYSLLREHFLGEINEGKFNGT